MRHLSREWRRLEKLKPRERHGQRERERERQTQMKWNACRLVARIGVSAGNGIIRSSFSPNFYRGRNSSSRRKVLQLLFRISIFEWLTRIATFNEKCTTTAATFERRTNAVCLCRCPWKYYKTFFLRYYIVRFSYSCNMPMKTYSCTIVSIKVQYHLVLAKVKPALPT